MSFAHPSLALLALAFAPALAWALARLERRRRAALAAFASGRLLERLSASVSPRRRAAKRLLLAAGSAFLLLAFARPQWGWREEEVKRRGVDLLFAVDTSRSMLAQDVRPNRLARAKLAVLDLLDRLEGDRVGLIAFAGTAFLQCPLTLDHDAFRASLDALEVGVIPKGGTHLAAALREASAALEAGAAGQKVLVLITDGEDLEQGALAAAREAEKAGLRVYTVGVGTAAGELIPIPGPGGALEFVKDPEGRVVKSRLDDKTLSEVASITGGIYQPLGAQGEGLLAVYEKGLAPLPRAQLLSRLHRTPIERFPWAVGAGLLLLAAEWLLGDRRRTTRPAPAQARRLGAATLLAAALSASPARAALWSAENAWREGRFQDALADYQKAARRDPSAPEVQFNLGAASYRTGDFARAAGGFLNAAKGAKTPTLPPRALYNLGNALYRVGQATEKAKPEDTVKAWENALQAYDQAIKLKNDDEDAKFNREFVRRKLEELKKKQPPQQDQKDSQGQQQQQPQASSQAQPDQGSPGSDSQQPQPKPKPEPGKDEKKDGANPKPDGPTPQPSNPQPPKTGKNGQTPSPQARKGDERAPQPAGRPGEMSAEEAKALLDGLKGDERKMPLAVDRMGRGQAQDEPPKRDW